MTTETLKLIAESETGLYKRHLRFRERGKQLLIDQLREREKHLEDQLDKRISTSLIEEGNHETE